jgi:hypothetical protein
MNLEEKRENDICKTNEQDNEKTRYKELLLRDENILKKNSINNVYTTDMVALYEQLKNSNQLIPYMSLSDTLHLKVLNVVSTAIRNYGHVYFMDPDIREMMHDSISCDINRGCDELNKMERKKTMLYYTMVQPVIEEEVKTGDNHECKCGGDCKCHKEDEKEKYEYVNHPAHYNNYSMEVIDMMEKIYGIESTALFCEMNAFKYRMRMGTKPDNDITQDLKKEKWYLDKAKELREKR